MKHGIWKNAHRRYEEGSPVMVIYGEMAAIATAICWSISVMLFRYLGTNFTPLTLNLWKGLLASSGLGIVLLFTNVTYFPQSSEIVWLLLSGAIGIGIGDTAFFSALNRMSESSTLLLTETLAPVLTAMLAMLWLAEWLSVWQWLAMAIILFGVDLVIRSRKKGTQHFEVSFSGLNFAALAALCQAIGAVIGRDVLTHSAIDSISASLLRLLGGLITASLIILFSRKSFLPKQAGQLSTWKILAKATFFGTFLAMIFQTLSFTYAPAAIVQALFASSIIFTLLLSWFNGQKITRNAFVGSSIAVVGVFLMMLF